MATMLPASLSPSPNAFAVPLASEAAVDSSAPPAAFSPAPTKLAILPPIARSPPVTELKPLMTAPAPATPAAAMPSAAVAAPDMASLNDATTPLPILVSIVCLDLSAAFCRAWCMRVPSSCAFTFTGSNALVAASLSVLNTVLARSTPSLNATCMSSATRWNTAFMLSPSVRTCVPRPGNVSRKKFTIRCRCTAAESAASWNPCSSAARILIAASCAPSDTRANCFGNH